MTGRDFRAHGMVYKALHVPTELELAVKTISIAKGSKASEEIMKEIEILKVCRHENVVNLYGSMHHEDCLWVIFPSNIFSSLIFVSLLDM